MANFSRPRRKHVVNTLLQKQGNRCCYCQCEMVRVNLSKTPNVPNALTIEHLHRVEDGGSSDMDNLALACLHCNYGRGRVDWFTYKSYKMGELSYA